MKYLIFKLVSIWVQVRDVWLYFFHHANIINCWVDDHTIYGIHHRNWGDDLNYYFIKLLTGRPVVTLFNFRLARRRNFKNFMCIGSLLGTEGKSYCNTVVWGTGMFGKDKLTSAPKEIRSVRGPKTRRFLLDQGISCPESYGDPALLLPLYYSPSKKPLFKLGIIPHVTDLEYPVIEEIRRKRKDVLIIDLAHYGKWTDVIDQICSCDMIASSSLHGLIVSDAYGVPNCWIELTGKISGGHFKYFDYASSVARKLTEPFVLKSIEQLPQIVELCSEWKAPAIHTQAIMDACPFKIRKPIMH
ncbi:MAG: polysaccharide pyruvyl transferase family protein [Prevotella sp.]|nr:polysaccharide pyruvyl transferase family protein [Prevotella sp.]